MNNVDEFKLKLENELIRQLINFDYSVVNKKVLFTTENDIASKKYTSAFYLTPYELSKTNLEDDEVAELIAERIIMRLPSELYNFESETVLIHIGKLSHDINCHSDHNFKFSVYIKEFVNA